MLTSGLLVRARSSRDSRIFDGVDFLIVPVLRHVYDQDRQIGELIINQVKSRAINAYGTSTVLGMNNLSDHLEINSAFLFRRG
jgi:hypothetical protein